MDFDKKIPRKPLNWTNDRLHFFKYMSFETAEIVLANRTLRWSTPRTLNDLYDVQFDLGLELDLERLEQLSYEQLWKVVSGGFHANEDSLTGKILSALRLAKNYESKEEFVGDFSGVVKECYQRMLTKLPETHSSIREHLENLKILCLTEDPSNPPMWAHYAQQNSGVVIRLRSIPAFDTPYGMAVPVDYLKEIPPFADEEHLSSVLAGVQTDDYRVQLNRMIYSKGLAWSYEKEWRISSGDGRNKTASHEDISFGLNDLDGVILGINMSSENRRTIIKLASSYPNAELLEARKSPSGFHHDIVPLEE